MKKRLIFIVTISMFLFSSISFSSTIQVWLINMSSMEKEIKLGLIDQYQKNSGNQVDISIVPFDALQGKYQTLAPQGQGPDVLVIPADWMGPFVLQNLIEPIDSFVKEEDLNKFIPNVLASCKYDNKLYGLPSSYTVISLVYNKDLISTPPSNTDEMIKIGKELINEDESRYGLIYDKGDFYYHIPWIGGFGGKVLDENNNPLFTSDASIKAAKFVKSLQESPNKIMPEDSDYSVMMELFTNGLAGMIIAGTWTIGYLEESGINYGVTKIPMVSETGLWPKPIVGPRLVVMSSYSKNKEGAYDFIKFLTSTDSQAKMATVGFLPSISEVYEYRQVRKSKVYETLMEFQKQGEVGIPMPTSLEMMAGIWGNGFTYLSQVFSANIDPIIAAKYAQENSLKSIKELRNK